MLLLVYSSWIAIESERNEEKDGADEKQETDEEEGRRRW